MAQTLFQCWSASSLSRNQNVQNNGVGHIVPILPQLTVYSSSINYIEKVELNIRHCLLTRKFLVTSITMFLCLLKISGKLTS